MMKRERIIVIAMIIVAVYGAYTFLSKPDNTTLVEGSKKRLADLKEFVVEAATSLSNEYISATDQYIIEQAGKRWPQNPFLQTGALLTSEPFEAHAEVTIESVKLSYTGFLQTPDKLLAIINGSEYERGEQLNEAGYYIKKISPRNVVIGIENNSENIILPLDESVSISLEAKE
jgi:hypothetical protein